MSDAPADRPETPRGAGALVLTEVEHVDLGTHGRYTLRARVERRSARFTLGRRWHVSFDLGRTRPVAVEVTSTGERYDLPIPARGGAWWRSARGIGVIWLAAEATVLVVRRMRARGGSG